MSIPFVRCTWTYEWWWWWWWWSRKKCGERKNDKTERSTKADSHISLMSCPFFFSSPFSRTTWQTFEEYVLLIIYLDNVSSKIFPNSKVETRIDFQDNTPHPEVYAVGSVLLWIRIKEKKKMVPSVHCRWSADMAAPAVDFTFLFDTHEASRTRREYEMWKEWGKKMVARARHKSKHDHEKLYIHIYMIYIYVCRRAAKITIISHIAFNLHAHRTHVY